MSVIPFDHGPIETAQHLSFERQEFPQRFAGTRHNIQYSLFALPDTAHENRTNFKIESEN